MDEKAPSADLETPTTGEIKRKPLDSGSSNDVNEQPPPTGNPISDATTTLSQPQPQAGNEVEAEAQARPQIEHQAESQSEPKSQSQSEPQTEPQARPTNGTTADQKDGPPPASTSTERKASRRISRKPVPSGIDIDKSRPEEFEGEVNTKNEIPSAKTLKQIEDYIVLDSDGRSHTFKTLYSGSNVARRVLIIFIRHFFCGMCQDYIRELSASISPDALLRLPVSTFIAIVGCGDPAFIPQYVADTNCKFPIYTDPKRSLFNALGMNQTLAMGTKPDYVKRTLSRSTIGGIMQGLRAIPQGLALKAGNQRQVGGEFLFEPGELVTPVTTPHEETRQSSAFIEIQGDSSGKASTEEECCHPVEEKRVTWCHRMKTTRDHCEIHELMDILGLDSDGMPVEDQERWQKTMRNRKGTGQSMARQMSELSALNEASAQKEAV